MAVMQLVLVTTHGLGLWLHPIGVRNWPVNMALGTFAFVMVMRRMEPWFVRPFKPQDGACRGAL